MSYRGTRNGKRFRSKRRRGRMTPAEAECISHRTRWNLWPLTKSITRWHRRDWTWSDDWNGD